MRLQRPTFLKARAQYAFPDTGAVMGFLHYYEEAMSNPMRNDMVATLAEFVGTFLWLLFAFAICQVEGS